MKCKLCGKETQAENSVDGIGYICKDCNDHLNSSDIDSAKNYFETAKSGEGANAALLSQMQKSVEQNVLPGKWDRKLYKDIASIKNMLIFFVVLTAINVMCAIIMLSNLSQVVSSLSTSLHY